MSQQPFKNPLLRIKQRKSNQAKIQSLSPTLHRQATTLSFPLYQK